MPGDEIGTIIVGKKMPSAQNYLPVKKAYMLADKSQENEVSFLNSKQ